MKTKKELCEMHLKMLRAKRVYEEWLDAYLDKLFEEQESYEIVDEDTASSENFNADNISCANNIIVEDDDSISVRLSGIIITSLHRYKSAGDTFYMVSGFVQDERTYSYEYVSCKEIYHPTTDQKESMIYYIYDNFIKNTPDAL